MHTIPIDIDKQKNWKKNMFLVSLYELYLTQETFNLKDICERETIGRIQIKKFIKSFIIESLITIDDERNIFFTSEGLAKAEPLFKETHEFYLFLGKSFFNEHSKINTDMKLVKK